MIGEKVLVTTKHRGVFFGQLESRDGETVILAGAQNCVYWPSDNHGFLGLAERGPLDGARVGPSVERLELMGVTTIARCSVEAIKRWEKAPWAA